MRSLRPRWLHPRRARLAAWLDDGGPEQLTAHIDQCDRCAGSLESLAANDEPTADLGAVLRDVLAPPDDLPGRLDDVLANRIAAREQQRRDARLLANMFGIGVETARVVFSPPPIDEEAPES